MDRHCRVGVRVFALGLALVLSGCEPAAVPTGRAPVGAATTHEFEGTWTAAGQRHSIAAGGERRASVAYLNGSLMLAGGSRPGVGFGAQAVVYNDPVAGMKGRAVWTDSQGDQVFSELQGEGTATGNRIVGRILGGTGRFAAASGQYEFAWRFVLETEDGTVQGQSVGLVGRVTAVAPAPAAVKGERP